MLEELFQPLKIGPVTIRNRIGMAPMATLLPDENGAVTQRLIDYYAARATGGAGLIIVEAAHVREDHRDIGRIGIENPQLQTGLSELAESIQEKGARAFLQLVYRESLGSTKGPDDCKVEEIEAVVEAFSFAALRAKKAGFDGVEIHGANVYLLTQFLSPLTNHRQDRYGRTLEGRTKFAEDILRKVRERVGEEYPVCFRMVGHQYADGGLDLEDTKRIARRLEEAGASALHVAAGSAQAPYWHTPPMAVPRGCHVSLAAGIKKVVHIPVMAVGRINDPVLANQIIQEGKADLIVMGRALLADPDLPIKARAGNLDQIRKCLACNYCRKRAIELNRTIRCAVNAQAGRERDLRMEPAPGPKTVWVVGGGPGGLEAARVSALRGHRVKLYEWAGKLGGQLNLALIPPHKEELRNILDYLTFQVKKLNIEVHLRSEVTPRAIEEEKPDAVILAGGARPLIPEIPGWDSARTYTPQEALEDNRLPGEKIIVLGGGMVGCEVAECLTARGKRVMIVEKLPEIASGLEKHTRTLLLERLRQGGVEMRTESEIVSLEGRKVTLQTRNGKSFKVEADGLVAALGARPVRSLEDGLQKSGVASVAVIGDYREARDIAAAIHDGFLAAMEV